MHCRCIHAWVLDASTLEKLFAFHTKRIQEALLSLKTTPGKKTGKNPYFPTNFRVIRVFLAFVLEFFSMILAQVDLVRGTLEVGGGMLSMVLGITRAMTKGSHLARLQRLWVNEETGGQNPQVWALHVRSFFPFSYD